MIEQSETANSLCCAVFPKTSKTKVPATYVQRQDSKFLPAPRGVWESELQNPTFSLPPTLHRTLVLLIISL